MPATPQAATDGWDLLVSPQWLADHLGAPDLAIVDASWYLPAMQRDGHAEYLAGHIPGAVYFDIDAIADHTTGLPHMLPTPVAFEDAMRNLGIGDGMRVVVYDGAGLFSAPRVWWMLRLFGVAKIAVLDGGLPAWRAEGHPVETGPVRHAPRPFTARPDYAAVADLDATRQVLATGAAQVFDARPADRFHGRAPEPRPGVRSGHMPGSLSLPATDLVAGGRLKSPDAIVAAFQQAGVDWSKPTVTSCGSGVSAAILTLALTRAGKPAGRVYDGSWSEWGSRDDLPTAVS